MKKRNHMEEEWFLMATRCITFISDSFIFGALFSSARIGYSIASRSIQAIGYARNEDYGRLALLSCELIEIQRIKNLISNLS